MSSQRIQRAARGMALLPIIVLVAALSLVAAFAIKVSGTERAEAGKSVHNVNMQTMADTTLQFGRNLFANSYHPNGDGWVPYLSYFVNNPVQLASRTEMTAYIAKLQTDHPELFVQLPAYLADDFDCFTYAQDDVDEFAPNLNNPIKDNNLMIYVGAVCAQRNQGGSTQGNQLIAEVSAPLLYTPSDNIIESQASGGSQGNNNETKPRLSRR